ncbi:MAG: alkaline phosphatase family protein [Pseudomonadota bacterium]|nr:alkaline phosphatase family protein [Pseudomonadota bacterium]
MRYLSLILLTALSSTVAVAQPARPPKLIIAISVDQYSSDLFDQYRSRLTGGLARLATGTAYRNGYQGHNASETCPGHSTILSGARPSRTGIIANTWFDLSQSRSDKAVYCAEDERVAGSSSSKYTVSPVHLKVPTLGELMKAADPASRSVAVAGKDRAAVMMSGQRPDQRWYWDGAKYATDLAGVATPLSVAAANQAVAALIAAPGLPLSPPADCAAASRSVPLGDGSVSVGSGRFERAAGDARAFRATPAFDGMTLALAARLIGEMQLGKRTATDIIAIGLSATDYVGHKFGTGGGEMCLHLHSLDRDMGDFLQLMDRSGLDYAVMLTSDHGAEDVPERVRLGGVASAARTRPGLTPAAIGKAIGATLGLAGPVLIGEGANGDVYIDAALKPADRRRAEQAALAAYRADPQVEAVFTKAQLARIPSPTATPDRWSLAERARASFDPQRSGDLVVLLKRNITPIADPTKGYVATHGSPWDYDRRVPILFWRPGARSNDRPEPVETVDIMPTLAALLNLPIDGSKIDGRCLASAAVASCPAR